MIGAFFKIFGKRFVFDQHDLMPEICESRWSGLKGRLLVRITSLMEQATYRLADVVISTNESYRQIAMQRGGKDPKRVVAVRSGPSKDRFTPQTPKIDLKEGHEFLVCYLGVMGPNDGIELMLDVIAHVRHQRGRNDVYFKLIGDGDIRPQAEAYAAQLRIENAVRFVGRIPDLEVTALLSTADLGLAPDPYDPLNDVSTMNKIIEYLAMGLPVVSFDLKEARVSAGDAAAYATPNDVAAFGDLLLELLSDASRRQKMSVTGRERYLNELCWEHQAPKLLHAYSLIES
jgi:asparagine synthase (glutamine-hydrolysing)